MHSEPVPPEFQLYFYSAIILAAIVSLIVIVLYRRAVHRNMLTRDEGNPDLATTSGEAAPARPFPNGRASDYALAEQYVKARIALIYSGAILCVVLLSVWIRFFSGTTILIRGSIMFMMWRLALGNFVALALSTLLFSAMGIPILAVLLAWNWRPAIARFLVFVAAWAAGTFALMIVVHGWSIANWAMTLVVFQIGLVALVAPQPFLLLLLTGHRRVRAVAPMTLAGSFVFCAVLLGGLFLRPAVFRLGTLSGIARIAALVILSLLVCWSLLRLLAVLYERKVYSDRQLLVDCWSLVVILYAFARLGETPGAPWLLIAAAFIVFLAYRLLIQLALRLLVRRIERLPNRRLLLLRTFGSQRRTERLFDAIGERWRFHGTVLMIAGADLAAHIINPADYLRFLRRRLRHGFIKSDTDLQRNLERLDDRPDPDGRYRVNELFCAEHAWRKAVVALLDRADVVLMDLRGFGLNNRGCVFELQQLVERGPAERVFLAVDDTTDLKHLEATIQDAWSMPSEARKHGAADLNIVPMTNSGSRAMEAIFTCLQGGRPATVPKHSRYGKATFLGAAAAAVLLISLLPMPWRRGQLATFEQMASKASLAGAYDNYRIIRGEVHKSLDAFDHRDRGIEMDRKGDHEAAMAEYHKVLEISPDLEDAHYYLGVDLDRKEDYDAAIEEYKKALAVKPNFAEAHYNLGVDLDRADNYTGAMAEYRKALALMPEMADAHYNLGVDLDRTHDYTAAIAEYRKALTRVPEMADAHYNLGIDLLRETDRDGAVAEFQRTLELKPNWAAPHLYLRSIANGHYNLGVDLDRKKEYDAAIVEYRKALSVNPQLGNAHYNLGVDFYKQGDSGAAVEEMRKALAVNPGLASAHYDIGRMLDEKGDWDAAILEYRKAVAIQSDFIDARYNLGADLDRKGDHEAAIAELRAVLAVKPELAEAHNELALALFAYGDTETAMAEFRSAISLKSDYAEAHYNLGIALYKKDNNEAAIKEYREALAIKPDLAEAHYNLAMALKDAGREQEAEQEFHEAQRLNPSLKRQ